MMAGFDLYSTCARYHDKKKGRDPCVEKPDSKCNALTPDHLAQLSTSSYKLKKEKRETKSSTPSKILPSSEITLSPSLVGPGTCVGSGGYRWP